MRLLITFDFPPAIGGIQQYLAGIVAHRFAADDCVLVCGIRAPATPPTAGSATVEYIPGFLRRKNRLSSLVPLIVRYILLCLRHKGVLRVECGTVLAAIIPWLFKPFLKQEYAVYTYGSELLHLRKNGIKNTLLRSALHGAKNLFALGSYTDALCRSAGCRQPITIVPPRIEMPAVGIPPAGTGEARTPFRIVSIGRLVPHKGHAVLIRAAALLNESAAYRLTIVGDGALHAPLAALCKSLGVASMVTMETHCSEEDKWRILASADCLAIPSLTTADGTEGFCIALLEAMALKIPIVASDSGGMPEVLDHGSCGSLVAPDDPHALAQAIRRVRDDRHHAQVLGEKAYERLLKKYVW